MKGVLILLVVLGHTLGFIQINGSHISHNEDYLGNLIYIFHMPLFVLVSGYFFAKSIDKPIIDIVVKQFNRLLIPEIVVDIIGLVIIFILWPILSDKIADNGVISIKKLYHYLTSEWFLFCIFFCSITVILFKTLFKEKWFFSISVFMIILLYFQKFLPGVIFHNQQLIKQLPFFTLGILLNKNISNIRQFKLEILILSSIIVSFYLLHNIADGNNLSFGFRKELICLGFVSIAYVAIKALYRARFFVDPFCLLGTNTLGIYIFSNYFFSFVLKTIGFKIDVGDLFWNYFIALLFSIIICYLFVYINNIIRKSRKLAFLFLGEKY